jgi:hypothetical protein
LALIYNGEEGKVIQSRAGAAYCAHTILSLTTDKKDKKRALDKIKQQRQSTNLSHLSRRNPSSLEKQIADLKQIESQGRLPEADKAVLITLEKELKQIYRAKAQFAGTAAAAAAGPTIVSDRTKGREQEKEQERQKELKKAFKDAVKGKRDPRRSVYYDEVWNPYGIPPPGMPWKERDEDDSEGISIYIFISYGC